MPTPWDQVHKNEPEKDISDLYGNSIPINPISDGEYYSNVIPFTSGFSYQEHSSFSKHQLIFPSFLVNCEGLS